MNDKEYSKIYDYIKAQILDSRYAAGQMLPPERLLCQQFNVSRITARHALRLLQEDGLVERFQGKGTFVKSIKPGKLPITDFGFAKSVKDYAPGLYRKLLQNEFIKAPQHIIESIGLDMQECFLAVRTDILNDKTIAFDRAYIVPKYCSGITEELLMKVDFFEKWLDIEKIKISYYSETIEAVEADTETAAILNIPLGKAVLKSIEIYYDINHRAFAVFESYYQGDKVKLTSTVNYKGRTNARVSNL